jgi:hypothetical protein
VLLTLIAFLVPVTASISAHAAPSDVCTSYKSMSNILYKFAASGHLANTERSNSCSLIYGKGNFTYPRGTRRLPLYDCNGTQVAVLKAYQLGGFPFPARYYTPKSQTCNKISRQVKSTCGNNVGYIGLNDGVCLKITNLRGRVGGVRKS